MSAEKIIELIKKDTAKEIKALQKQAELQVEQIKTSMKQVAQKEAEIIIEAGKIQAETTKKIQLSRAGQEIKREIIKTKEEIIESCFAQALDVLSKLDKTQYTTIVSQLMKKGKQQLGEKCTVLASQDLDQNIAKNLGLQVTGTIDASGGIVMVSHDGNITLDYTFQAILQRKKDEIRINIGKILFNI